MLNFGVIILKRKYQNNAKLSHVDSESFIIHIKTQDFYILLMMLKNCLTYQTIVQMIKDHFQEERTSKKKMDFSRIS